MAHKPNSAKMTPQRERFCNNIVNGMTQTDAYLTAYGCRNRKTAREEASRLMKLDLIRNRITELRNNIAYRISWSKADSEKYLTDIARESSENGDYRVAIDAIKELNKMCGYHAPTTSVSANVEVTSGDIDAIMLNLGYKRTGLLGGGQDE